MPFVNLGEIRQEPALAVEAPGEPSSSAVERAIVLAIAYADVFEYPLTVPEAHRYLVGVKASPELVNDLLQWGRLTRKALVQRDDFWMLRGREEIVATRRRRAAVAARVWPRALRYGWALARLPFVRMVAVTGALAVDNVEQDADIDYLVVTEPGRLWLCRGLVIALVRAAAIRGEVICPNYFISERALVLSERSLYTAHELLQMAPLSGLATYQRLRDSNRWAEDYLPNAEGAPPHANIRMEGSRRVTQAAEAAMRTRAGARLERWEMERKLRKFGRQRSDSTETAFCADWCKGHFDGHGQRTLAAFGERMRGLNEVMV